MLHIMPLKSSHVYIIYIFIFLANSFLTFFYIIDYNNIFYIAYIHFLLY